VDLTPEQKKARAEKYAKFVIAGVVCAAVSPVIFLVVKGLIGLILAVGIGFVTLQFTPWFAMKVANLRMKAIMNEAAKNPIETMNNVYTSNMRTIQETDSKIAQFEARLGDFRSKMNFFANKYPNDVPQFQETAAKMQAVLVRQKAKQKAAKIAARDFHDQIVRAEAIYEMALAAHEVQKLSGDLEKQVFDDIKKRVSFDSVTHAFNTAVAELSVEADTDPDTFLTDTPVKGALPETTEGSYPLPKATVIDAELVPVGKGPKLGNTTQAISSGSPGLGWMK